MAKIGESINASVTDASRTDESFGRGGVSMTLGDGATVVQGSGNGRGGGKWLLPCMGLAIFALGIGWLREDVHGKIDLQTAHTDARFDKMADRVETAKSDILKNRELVDEVTRLARDNRAAIDRNSETLKKLKTDCDDLDRREKNSEGAWVWLFRRDIILAIDGFKASGTMTQKDYDILKEEVEYYHNKLKGNHDIADRWETLKMLIATQKVKVTE